MGTVRARVHLGTGGELPGSTARRGQGGPGEGSQLDGARHLVLLLEAIALGRLHLVDVLQEVGHAHRGVQLPRVIRGALPAARPPW